MASYYPTQPVDTGHQRQLSLDAWLRIGLCLAVAGACMLPLVPVWRAAISLIAIAWLVTRHGPRRYRALLMTAVLGAGLIYLASMLLLCLANPAQVIIGSVQFAYGLPINTVAATAQLFGELIIAAGLVFQTYRSASRYHRIFVASCGAFGAWAAFSAIWNAVTIAAGQADIVLAGATTWIDWTIAAMLSAALFRQGRLPSQFVEVLCYSAALIAAAIMIQWAIADYSYVLTTFDSLDFFARTRASYYYHAPATQFLAFSMPVVAILAIMRPKNPLYALLVALCGTALFVNGTRGISLAVVVGIGALVTFLAVTRRSSNLIVAALIILVLALATQVVYVKPAASPAGWDAAANGFAQSNAARRELALAGMVRISQRPIVGFGPGYGELVESLDGSGQQLATVSSHVLAIDLATMGGIPALIAFAGIVMAPAFGAAVTAVRRPGSPQGLFCAGFAAALTIFILTSFFLPQENSSIIMVAMMLAGVISFSYGREPDAVAPSTPLKQRRASLWGLWALSVCFAGWLVMTSPSYVFPSLEFVARYGAELKSTRAPVYTTNPTTNAILGFTLKLAGVDVRPSVLPDEPAQLPVQSGFIVWAPADEFRYPTLRAFLGPALERPYFQWMSVKLLRSWTLINNFQPTVQFIRVGPPAPAAEAVTLPATL